MPNPQETSDLASRLENLEATVRWWRRCMACLAISTLLIVTMAATRQQIPRAPDRAGVELQGTIEARSIRIVDQRGDVKLVLGSNDAGPMVELFDRQGLQSMVLYVNETGPNIYLNKQQDPVAWITYWGNYKCGAIVTYNNNGEKAAVLGALPSGDGGIWRRVGDQEKFID